MTVVAQLSEEERRQVAELRKLVADDLTPYYDTEFNLLRWLQGHQQLPLPQIAQKLRHHLKMRKSTWKLDEYLKGERNHPIHRHWARGITGPSGVLDNVVVNIEQCGRTDYTGMMETFSIAEVMRARIYDLEEMLAMCMELERKTGRQAWVLYVMDVSGLEYNRKLYDLVTGSMKSLAEFMADHYVEMIKYFVPVSLPTFATALYTVVRPLLPKRTEQKVRMLSASNWKEEMLQYGENAVLPAFWSDEKHSFPAKLERPIPYPIEKYYSKLGNKLPAGVESIDVVAGSCWTKTLNLVPGDRVSWFASGNRNFGFGFLKAKNEEDVQYEEMDQMIPTFPWMPGPTLVPLDDSLEIKEEGVYKFWISNSRSWWSTLTVQFSVRLDDAVEET